MQWFLKHRPTSSKKLICPLILANLLRMIILHLGRLMNKNNKKTHFMKETTASGLQTKTTLSSKKGKKNTTNNKPFKNGKSSTFCPKYSNKWTFNCLQRQVMHSQQLPIMCIGRRVRFKLCIKLWWIRKIYRHMTVLLGFCLIPWNNILMTAVKWAKTKV